MKNLIWILLLSPVCLPPAYGAVNLVEKDDWKVDMSGFVETDLFYDSTKSFTEVIGNTPVGVPNGQKGRTQMSIRNSRLGFNVQAPTFEDWKSRGYMEFDLLGYDGGTPGANENEAAFFSNPNLRVRHAYIASEKDGWQFLTGQTWNLLGWQPYYFIPTIQVAPIGGMLYNRTVQMRAMKAYDSGEQTWQFALALMRPPQRDSQLPSFEAGARWSMNGRKAAFTGGATGGHTPQPMSVGLSGTVRDFEVNTDTNGNTSSHTGMGMALDVLVPVLTSGDGKSTGNNLMIGGEFTTGQGYGDQFNSWTGGQYNPLATSVKANDPAATDKTNLDSGIGGYDFSNQFNLIQIQTFNLYAQYHLPESMRAWVSAGYSQLYSPNMGSINTAYASSPYYDKESTYFANISHDCTPQVRVGFEYANVHTHYVSGLNPQDNRFQYSAWFIF